MQGIVVSWKCNKRLREPISEIQSGQWIFHPHSILVQKAKLLLSGFFTGETWTRQPELRGPSDLRPISAGVRGADDSQQEGRPPASSPPTPGPKADRGEGRPRQPEPRSHDLTADAGSTHDIFIYISFTLRWAGGTLWRPRILRDPGPERRLESLPHPRRAGH